MVLLGFFGFCCVFRERFRGCIRFDRFGQYHRDQIRPGALGFFRKFIDRLQQSGRQRYADLGRG